MEVLMHEASNGQEMNTIGSPIYATEKQLIKDTTEDKQIDSATVRFMETKAVDTVDIIFENITYTVSLGCRKGQSTQNDETSRSNSRPFPSTC